MWGYPTPTLNAIYVTVTSHFSSSSQSAETSTTLEDSTADSAEFFTATPVSILQCPPGLPGSCSPETPNAAASAHAGLAMASSAAVAMSSSTSAMASVATSLLDNVTMVTDCQDNVDRRLVAPVVMGLVGVAGNVLALVVLYNTKMDRRRSAFYTLVAGLALTDLLGQLFTAPLAIAAYSRALDFSTEEGLCKFHGFLMVSFGLITPLIVCLMALERIGALCCTYFCSRFVSRSHVRMALVGTWVFAMTFAVLPLGGFGVYEPQFPCSWCFLKFHFSPDDFDGSVFPKAPKFKRTEREVIAAVALDTRASFTGTGGHPEKYQQIDDLGTAHKLKDPSVAVYAGLYACINLLIILITVISNIVVIVELLRARKRRQKWVLNRRCHNSGSGHNHHQQGQQLHARKAAAAANSNLSQQQQQQQQTNSPKDSKNKKQNRKCRTGSQGGAAAMEDVAPPRGENNSNRRESQAQTQRAAQDLELQMVWLLCGMTLVFTCCWTPFMYQILVSVLSKEDTKPSEVDMQAVRAAAFNQILDPWVYILLRRSIFRKVSDSIRRLFRFLFAPLRMCYNNYSGGGAEKESRMATDGKNDNLCENQDNTANFLPLMRRSKKDFNKEEETTKVAGGREGRRLLGGQNTEEKEGMPGIVLSVLTHQPQRQQQQQQSSVSFYSMPYTTGSGNNNSLEVNNRDHPQASLSNDTVRSQSPNRISPIHTGSSNSHVSPQLIPDNISQQSLTTADASPSRLKQALSITEVNGKVQSAEDSAEKYCYETGDENVDIKACDALVDQVERDLELLQDPEAEYDSLGEHYCYEDCIDSSSSTVRLPPVGTAEVRPGGQMLDHSLEEPELEMLVSSPSVIYETAVGVTLFETDSCILDVVLLNGSNALHSKV